MSAQVLDIMLYSQLGDIDDT